MKTPLLAGDLSGGLPGSNVTRGDLPDGPKPGEALKNLPKGSAGSQVSGQVQIWNCGCAIAGTILDCSCTMACNVNKWAVLLLLRCSCDHHSIVKLSWQTSRCQQCTAHQLRCVHVQVSKAASKGGSVADKAGSAVKDIKGKNPFGELDFPQAECCHYAQAQTKGWYTLLRCLSCKNVRQHLLLTSAAISMDME